MMHRAVAGGWGNIVVLASGFACERVTLAWPGCSVIGIGIERGVLFYANGRPGHFSLLFQIRDHWVRMLPLVNRAVTQLNVRIPVGDAASRPRTPLPPSVGRHTRCMLYLYNALQVS